MSEKIVQLNEEIIKGQIRELVRGSVEETLNELLEKEAESLTQAALYKRLTFELIFNLAITRSFLRATFNVIHMVPVIRILRFG